MASTVNSPVTAENAIGTAEHTSSTPKTPTKRHCPSVLEEDDKNQEQVDTVRRRRGFRPLSVLTRSVLFPFDLETLRAMDALRDDSRDSAASSPISVSGATPAEYQDWSSPTAAPEHDLLTTKSDTNDGKDDDENTPSASRLYNYQIRYPASRSLVTVASTNESEISLREFLQTSTPSAHTITADYNSLSQLLPPDPTQHPACQLTPFASRSESPNLVTTTVATEIRKSTAQLRSSQSCSYRTWNSGSSDTPDSAEKKRSLWSSIRTPESLRKRESKSPMDSPLSMRHRPIEIPALSLRTAFSDDNEKKRIGSGGLRKLSDMFRSRASGDKLASTEKTSPTNSEYSISPSLDRPDLETRLRRVTSSPTYSYHADCYYPRHPTTARSWKSRNLRCTTCAEVGCAVCGRACCAYKAAVLALESHKNNPQNRRTAIERIQQITTVYPYGKEVPTFLQCTNSGGEGAGCGRMVCPDCCGVCPDEVCADLQCRKCKKDPWSKCEWHTNSDVSMISRDNHSIVGFNEQSAQLDEKFREIELSMQQMIGTAQ